MIKNRVRIFKKGFERGGIQLPPQPVFYNLCSVKTRRFFAFGTYKLISPPYIFIIPPVFPTAGKIKVRRNFAFAIGLIVVSPPLLPAVNSRGIVTSRLLLQRFQPNDTARVLIRGIVYDFDFYAIPRKTVTHRDIRFYPVVGSFVLSFLWEFGDGRNSIERSPTHQYEQEGLYTVTLSLVTLYGNFSLTKQYYIEILGLPVFFDTGEAYLNYGLPSQRLLGATRGGNVFNVETEYHSLERDGEKGSVIGCKMVKSTASFIEVNLIELSADAITLAIPGAECLLSDGKYTITRSRQIKNDDYANNIAIVGDVQGRDYSIICMIYNALADGTLEFSFNENDESVLKIKFRGHYDLFDLEKEPWDIKLVE